MTDVAHAAITPRPQLVDEAVAIVATLCLINDTEELSEDSVHLEDYLALGMPGTAVGAESWRGSEEFAVLKNRRSEGRRRRRSHSRSHIVSPTLYLFF